MLGMIRNSLFGSVETWPWQVLSTGGKEEVSYEERACEGGKFATVEVTDKPVDEALREAMPKIMKYVGGTNDKGIGMGMTVPISFAVFPNEDGSLQKKLKVWFRIPNQFQSSPPVPSDESVKIEEREGITVYSKQFGGYAKEADYIAHATQLRTALEGTPATYQGDVYYCTGYDPPMKPYGRRNEVWLVKT
ncbi:heme-binding protein 1 [Peromyscus eremicus]|uniref:heme-binding protein 1 n=1 Tax=Peromyscus eremicus TaxID=42410 RepID=UPI0022A7FAAA|nr:heme-binding protein 1 isoform X1 [Peromyscus californicus insignis]XP_059112953.1 heme-binding protein 1 [Peromyscus eremicus]